MFWRNKMSAGGGGGGGGGGRGGGRTVFGSSFYFIHKIKIILSSRSDIIPKFIS